MKTYTKIFHRIVKVIHVEWLFASLTRLNSIFQKFIPLPAEYSRDDSRLITRNSTRFNVNLSDYMQWCLFANIPDNTWKLAIPFLSNKPSVVLDIGANCGHFALKLAVYCKKSNISNVRIHAFEPNLEVYNALSNNSKLNSLSEDQLVLHSCGLGSKNEQRFFDFNVDNLGGGRVLPENCKGKLQVTIRKLDDVVAEIKPERIAFIKIDAEGFEPEILFGSEKTLMKFKPPVFFEVTPVWYKENGHDAEDIFKMFHNMGYRLYVESKKDLLSFHPQQYTSTFQYNLLGLYEPK